MFKSADYFKRKVTCISLKKFNLYFIIQMFTQEKVTDLKISEKLLIYILFIACQITRFYFKPFLTESKQKFQNHSYMTDFVFRNFYVDNMITEGSRVCFNVF